MTTITIKTVKRTSGYQARCEMPWGQPMRVTGCDTRETAEAQARTAIKRVMDTRTPGMDSIAIEVVRG